MKPCFCLGRLGLGWSIGLVPCPLGLGVGLNRSPWGLKYIIVNVYGAFRILFLCPKMLEMYYTSYSMVRFMESSPGKMVTWIRPGHASPPLPVGIASLDLSSMQVLTRLQDVRSGARIEGNIMPCFWLRALVQCSRHTVLLPWRPSPSLDHFPSLTLYLQHSHPHLLSSQATYSHAST